MIEFDFFPFNLPPGLSFLAVYVLLATGCFIALGTARGAIASALSDGPTRPAVPPPGSLGPSYRAANAPNRPEALGIGWLPDGAQVWTVAWLRGGTAAVAEALVAGMISEGWFTPDEGNTDALRTQAHGAPDRKSTRLNSSHSSVSRMPSSA